MALKDWIISYKEAGKYRITIFENFNTRQKLSVAKEYGTNKYKVEYNLSNNIIRTKIFDKKILADNFAKAYMKKH